MIGIARLGASRSSLFVNLLPVVVAILAASLLHEQLHGYDFIGGGLALLGVMLGMRDAKVAPKPVTEIAV